MSCFDDFQLVDKRIDEVLTQYRESPKLLHLLRSYLREAEIAGQAICDLPSKFDLDTAVGDQLTLLGLRMGWPRCHCICETQRIFGFECNEPTDFFIGGLCNEEVTWEDCADLGVGNVCIQDDDLYRKFLKVRRAQIAELFDFQTLVDAAREMWGPDANVLSAGNYTVVLGTGRELEPHELALLQLYPRVFPTALGVTLKLHIGGPRVFGFGNGWGGFCEDLYPDGLVIYSDGNSGIVEDTPVYLVTEPITQDAGWMCPVDPKPQDC